MGLPLVLALPQIINGVAIFATAVVVGDAINKSLNNPNEGFSDSNGFQPLGGFDTTSTVQNTIAPAPPENPVWNGQSTGTGLLENQLADSRRQSLRDSYMPIVGSPPLVASPTAKSPTSSEEVYRVGVAVSKKITGVDSSGYRQTYGSKADRLDAQMAESARINQNIKSQDLKNKLSPALGSAADLGKGEAANFPNSIAASLGSSPNQPFPFGFPLLDNGDNGSLADNARINNYPAVNDPPFKGGQSQNVMYRIDFRVDDPDGQFVYTSLFTVFLRGSIKGIKKYRSEAGTFLIGVENTFGEIASIPNYGGADEENAAGITATITSVKRLDGLADTGGDPPPLIPNQAPSPPPPYPPANEWPYGDVNVKIGGVSDAPPIGLPQISGVKPMAQTSPADNLSPVVNNPAIAQSPSGFASVPSAASTPNTPSAATTATTSGLVQVPATQIPATQIYANGLTNADYNKLATPSFPQVQPLPVSPYQSGSQVTPTPTTTTTQQSIVNTTPSTSQTTDLKQGLDNISQQISQIKTKVKEAICEESAPNKCIDNAVKRNKPENQNQEPEMVSISVREFVSCEGESPKFTNRTISVLKGTEIAVQGIYENLADLEALQCKGLECYAAVPEWWQIRPEGRRAQIVLQFCAEESKGVYGAPKYAITLPHPSVTTKLLSPPLPEYEKGNFEGILRLKDNSKLIVNCSSRGECERVLSQLKGFIRNDMLNGSDTKFSERNGKPVKKQKMVARFATYFENGIEDASKYKWKAKFNLPS